MLLPTVIIKTENGPVVINETDYDPKIHVIEGGEEASLSLRDMTATQLKSYAAENNIDIKGLKSKEDLLAAITKEDDKAFIVPNENGLFVIMDKDGKLLSNDTFDSFEEAEKNLKGE